MGPPPRPPDDPPGPVPTATYPTSRRAGAAALPVEDGRDRPAARRAGWPDAGAARPAPASPTGGCCARGARARHRPSTAGTSRRSCTSACPGGPTVDRRRRPRPGTTGCAPRSSGAVLRARRRPAVGVGDPVRAADAAGRRRGLARPTRGRGRRARGRRRRTSWSPGTAGATRARDSRQEWQRIRQRLTGASSSVPGVDGLVAVHALAVLQQRRPQRVVPVLARRAGASGRRTSSRRSRPSRQRCSMMPSSRSRSSARDAPRRRGPACAIGSSRRSTSSVACTWPSPGQ